MHFWLTKCDVNLDKLIPVVYCPVHSMYAHAYMCTGSSGSGHPAPPPGFSAHDKRPAFPSSSPATAGHAYSLWPTSTHTLDGSMGGCMYMYTHKHAHTNAHTHTHTGRLYGWVYVHVHTYTHTHKYSYCICSIICTQVCFLAAIKSWCI